MNHAKYVVILYCLLCRTKTYPEVNFLSYKDRKRILVNIF